MKKAYLNRVLVEVIKKEKTTESGLIVKEEENSIILSGAVKSIGSLVEGIEEGMNISFQKFDGVEVEKNLYSVIDEKILSID